MRDPEPVSLVLEPRRTGHSCCLTHTQHDSASTVYPVSVTQGSTTMGAETTSCIERGPVRLRACERSGQLGALMDRGRPGHMKPSSIQYLSTRSFSTWQGGSDKRW